SLTGPPWRQLKQRPGAPDLFPIPHLLRSAASRALPNYVGVNPIPYIGSAYLGPAYEPFAVSGDPNDPKFEVPNIGIADPVQARRLGERIGLRRGFDPRGRAGDRRGEMPAAHSFPGQAGEVASTAPDPPAVAPPHDR